MTKFKTILVLKRVEVPEERLNAILSKLVEEKYEKYIGEGYEVKRNITILPTTNKIEQDYIKKFGAKCADSMNNIHTYFEEGNLMGIYQEVMCQVTQAFYDGRDDERQRHEEED